MSLSDFDSVLCSGLCASSFPDFVEVRSGVTGKEVCVVGGVPGRGGSGM